VEGFGPSANLTWRKSIHSELSSKGTLAWPRSAVFDRSLNDHLGCKSIVGQWALPGWL
jgi:hypothetical protein